VASLLVVPVEPCKPGFAGSDLLHDCLQLGVGRQLAARPAGGLVLTDMPLAPLACQLEPLDSDLAVLILICHNYLVAGLSDVERRARGKRPESRTNAEAAVKSSPASRSAPGGTSQSQERRTSW
jgi:hypothetical protein